MRNIFQCIHDTNAWGGGESVSGPGSSLAATKRIREGLPPLFLKWGIRSVLDIPCGDFNWMSKVVEGLSVTYAGGDILLGLVMRNAIRWPQYVFYYKDITASDLPEADVILVRDCLVHFSFHDALRALQNIRMARFVYLLMTHFPMEEDKARTVYNVDVPTGHWRPLDFTRPPFNLPPPIDTINEGNEGHPNKELALWKFR